MKILSAAQIREADQYTILNEAISSVQLMEKAAKACTEWLIRNIDLKAPVHIVCGTGNNGGDGLAIARLLSRQQCSINVHLVKTSDNRSADNLENLKRLKEISSVIISEINSASDFSATVDGTLLDCIFGTGLNKPLSGWVIDLIEKLNKTDTFKIAIDIPTGLYADDNSGNSSLQYSFRADVTLSFQQPKLSFLFTENYPFTGDFILLDIGLSEKFYNEAQCSYYFITNSDIKPYLKIRPKFSHKGTFGHACIIAGSKGKMGAAVLATKACVVSGAGLTTAVIPGIGYNILQTSIPEAMVIADNEQNFTSGFDTKLKFQAIGIGPGIGLNKHTANVLKLLIQEKSAPMVIDADALNILGENKTWLSFLTPGTILTPHPKEFDRLTEVYSNSYERLLAAIQFSRKHGVIVVLKGAYTATCLPNGDVLFNSTGNSGLAKGGSGDVLTGMITAFRAQGYTAPIAAMFAVYIHGLAADIAIEKIAKESLLAGDVIDHISDAFNKIATNKWQ